jgi:hypothetical protein
MIKKSVMDYILSKAMTGNGNFPNDRCSFSDNIIEFWLEL